jgi:hypothetical protein
MSFAQRFAQAADFDALVSSTPIGSGGCKSVVPQEIA